MVAQDRILVVEDDPVMLAVLRQGFEQEHLTVHVAADGREGFHFASQNTVEAIVLDVMLPVMDGFTVAKELRSLGNGTPILMLTARDAVTDVVHGLNSGVDDYLTKPFSFLELSARIRALIRRAKPRLTRWQVGDLTLDALSHEVFRSSHAIHLSKTEFQILEMLMSRRGQVVRRQELFQEVWGQNAAVEDNTLDVAMSSLRARIDFPGLPKLIHTIRGFGYRLEVFE